MILNGLADSEYTGPTTPYQIMSGPYVGQWYDPATGMRSATDPRIKAGPVINDYMRFKHYMRARDISGLQTIPWSIILDYQARAKADGLNYLGEGVYGTSNLDAVLSGYTTAYPGDVNYPFGPLFKYGDNTSLIKLDAWAAQQGDVFTLAYLTPAANGYTNVEIRQEYHADTFMRDFGIGLVVLATAGVATAYAAPAAAAESGAAASGSLIAPVAEISETAYAGTAAMQAAATSDAAFDAWAATTAAAESSVSLVEFGGTAIAESLGTSGALSTLETISKASSVVTKSPASSSLFEQAVKAAPFVKTALSFIKQTDPVTQGAVYHRIDPATGAKQSGSNLIMDENGNVKTSSALLLAGAGLGLLFLLRR